MAELMSGGSPEAETRTAKNSDGEVGSLGHRLRERAVDEARRFVVMFFYLWILLGFFVLNETVILRERGISFAPQGFALLNALILAKVMLLAEDLNLGRWMRRRSLVYRILFESFFLTALFICFHVAEHVVIGAIKQETFQTSVPAIGGGGLLGLLCVAVILFVALIPFFAFRNIGRELGPSRLNAILFGPAINNLDDG